MLHKKSVGRCGRWILAATLVFLIASPRAHAQAPGLLDSYGTEFWLAFPGNLAPGATQLFLYVVGTGPATVTMDFAPVAGAWPAAPYQQTFALTAGSIQPRISDLAVVLLPIRSVVKP